jgi:hypothetical protein
VSRLARIRKELHDPRGTARDIWRARRLARAHPDIATLITSLRRDGLTYLHPVNLWGLAGALLDLDERAVDGAIVETGTALGGSAIMLAKLRTRPRDVLVYDAFGMIPAPSDRDGDDVHKRYETIKAGESKGLKGDTYYGYRDDLLGDVTRSFERYGQDPRTAGVTLVPGFFDESLQIDQPVALAHIDCDWYDSVAVSLERIVPHVVPGGRLVIDDYYTYSGCRAAVDDFLRGRTDLEPIGGARLHLLRR